MLSNLENGPTENDLELLLNNNNDNEKKIFVDLTNEFNISYNINSKNSTDQNFNKLKYKKNSNKIKLNKKIKNKKSKNKYELKDDSDELSINSDNFIVPDDEIIPPDWEYDFQEPIVCENVTFYNKIDNILINENENKKKHKSCKSNFDKKNLININIENEYVDDKDNTKLILEDNLYIKNKDEYINNLNNFEYIENSCNENININKIDNLINNYMIYSTIKNFINSFNIYIDNKNLYEFNKSYEENDFNLILLFKSIEIEFNNLFINNNNNIHVDNNNVNNMHVNNGNNNNNIYKYLDLFYTNVKKIAIMNEFDKNLVNIFKELHIEMLNFLEKNIEEIKFVKLKKHNSNLMFYYLKIIGLTILTEHLLILLLKSMNLNSENELQNLSITSIFNQCNKFNKSNISKILKKILNTLLDYIINIYIENNKFKEIVDLEIILILFLNIKLNGYDIFAYINKYLNNNNNNNNNIRILQLFNLLIFIYSNNKDLNLEISNLFPKIILNKYTEKLNKDDYYSYLYLLNNYLININIYLINNKDNINHILLFESFKYYLSELKIFCNINNNYSKNIVNEIDKDNESLLIKILEINVNLQTFNIQNLKKHTINLENILKLFLFLDLNLSIDKSIYEKLNTEIKSNNYINENSKENIINKLNKNWLNIIQELYFNILNISKNLIININQWNDLLEYISNIFDFDNISYINRYNIIIHFMVYNGLFLSLYKNNEILNLELNSLFLIIYNNYIDLNDKINNLLLTETILDKNKDEKNSFYDNIYLNKYLKLFVKLFSIEKEYFNFEICYYLSLIEDLLILMNNDKINYFDVKYGILEKKEIKELLLINSLDEEIKLLDNKKLILNSKIIELLNKSKLFNNLNDLINVEQKISHANKLHANKIHAKKMFCCDYFKDKSNNFNDLITIFNNQNFKKIFIYYKILLENILNNYLFSIFNILINIDNEENIYYNIIEVLFELLNHILKFLLINGKNLYIDFIYDLINNYCILLSEKLFFYYNIKHKDINIKDKFISNLIFYSYKCLIKSINYLNLIQNNINHLIFLIIIINMLIINNEYYMKYFYNHHIILDKELFKLIKITHNQLKFNPKYKKIISLNYISNNNLSYYYYKFTLSNNINLLYKHFYNIDNDQKNKINIILNNLLFEYNSYNQENNLQHILNYNDIYLKLFFEYYINTLDYTFLNNFNKIIIKNSFNLYSKYNIYSLLINLLLKGFDEKKIEVNNNLLLNWNYINNSIKGYINQLNDDLLIYDWISNHFIKLFIIPSTFIYGFINIRVNFWTNLLTIPLSKLIIHSNNINHLNQILLIIKYFFKYIFILIKLHDIIISDKYLLDFSINFIIDINRLIYLSYFNTIINIILTIYKDNKYDQIKFNKIIIFFSKLLISIIIILHVILIKLSNYSSSDLFMDINSNITILKSYFIQILKFLLSNILSNIQIQKNINSLKQISMDDITKQNYWINHLLYNNKQQINSSICQYISENYKNYQLNHLFQEIVYIYFYIKSHTNRNHLPIYNLLKFNINEKDSSKILNIFNYFIDNIQNNSLYNLNHFIEFLSGLN